MDRSQIDTTFRDAIKSNPKVARSHFEIVDPGTWRFDVSGRLSGLGKEWFGPYQFCDDGVDYDAYGLRTGILASQKVLLDDLGISVSQRGLRGLMKVSSVAIGTGLLVAIAVWFYDVADAQSENKAMSGSSESQCINSECTDAATEEMFEKLKKRNFGKAERDKRIAFVGQPPSAAVEKSIKERAHDAFHESRWDEAINLVDQMSEKEADAELRYYIGICYKDGHAVAHDYAEAFHWFKSAAEMGNAAAQYELGLAYEKGNGVAVDFAEAIRWYGTAARRDNAMGNLFLGLMYDEGRGVEQDPSEAAKWYRAAAELGNAHAGYLLGRLYYEGRGVKQSFSLAADMYRKVGYQDHADAGFRLGEMYEKGIGVEKNSSEALYWYKKAGELGHEAARLAWQRLSNTDKMWIHPKK